MSATPKCEHCDERPVVHGQLLCRACEDKQIVVGHYSELSEKDRADVLSILLENYAIAPLGDAHMRAVVTMLLTHAYTPSDVCRLCLFDRGEHDANCLAGRLEHALKPQPGEQYSTNDLCASCQRNQPIAGRKLCGDCLKNIIDMAESPKAGELAALIETYAHPSPEPYEQQRAMLAELIAAAYMPEGDCRVCCENGLAPTPSGAFHENGRCVVFRVQSEWELRMPRQCWCPLCEQRDAQEPGALCAECQESIIQMGMYEPDTLNSMLMQLTTGQHDATLREKHRKLATAIHEPSYDVYGGCKACNNEAGRPHKPECWMPKIEKLYQLTPPEVMPYL